MERYKRFCYHLIMTALYSYGLRWLLQKANDHWQLSEGPASWVWEMCHSYGLSVYQVTYWLIFFILLLTGVHRNFGHWILMAIGFVIVVFAIILALAIGGGFSYWLSLQ